MKRAVIFFPLVGLIGFAGYLGLKSGQHQTDSVIVARYATIYVETTPPGARLTDCAAGPYPDPTVRMVVSCVHPLGQRSTFYVGPRGELVAEPKGPAA